LRRRSQREARAASGKRRIRFSLAGSDFNGYIQSHSSLKVFTTVSEANLLPSTYNLDIPFRGERQYLHSTTFITALLGLFPGLSNLKLDFRQMIHHPIVLDADMARADRFGMVSFDDGDVKRKFGIYCDLDRSVEERVACNEKAINDLYDSGTDASTGLVGKPGNFIETIVALNKAAVARRTGAGKKVIFRRSPPPFYPRREKPAWCSRISWEPNCFVPILSWLARRSAI
jgi:hypothetical protein